MKQEIDAAVDWWAIQLSKTVKSETIVERFRSALCSELKRRWAGHWHEEERLRGSGLRSISVERSRFDPVLRVAADACGMQSSIHSLLEHCIPMLMFINPGEVKVKRFFEPIQFVYRSAQPSLKPQTDSTSAKVLAGDSSSRVGNGASSPKTAPFVTATSTKSTSRKQSRRQLCKRSHQLPTHQARQRPAVLVHGSRHD